MSLDFALSVRLEKGTNVLEGSDSQVKMLHRLKVGSSRLIHDEIGGFDAKLR